MMEISGSEGTSGDVDSPEPVSLPVWAPLSLPLSLPVWALPSFPVSLPVSPDGSPVCVPPSLPVWLPVSPPV